MKITVKSIMEKLIWLLTVFVFFAFTVFNEPSWGKYTILGASVLIAVLTAMADGGVLRLRIEAYHVFVLIFGLFTLASSLWAPIPSDAITKASTVFQILLCAALAYLHYQKHENMHGLISAVIWAGYAIAIYTIATYGLDHIIEAAIGRRLVKVYNNSNTIGMAIAHGCILQIYELFYGRKKWSALLMIPAILVVAATQSKKAILMLIIGAFLIYYIKNAQGKGNLKKIFKLIIFTAALIAAVWGLSKVPIFSGITNRIMKMIAVFKDEGTDYSTDERMLMIELGKQAFREHPLFGIGIGSGHIILEQAIGKDTYLHNNFLEILCGGGIVGFCLYYAMYAYILVQLFRYRKADPDQFTFGLAWLVIMMILDYAVVTYYNKAQWYYLMIHFLNVQCLRRKHEGNTDAIRKIA